MNVVFLSFKISYCNYVKWYNALWSQELLPSALAGVAQWTKRRPVNRKVAGSIPNQGTCLGCGPGPCLGAGERQPTGVFLAYQRFSLPSTFSENK